MLPTEKNHGIVYRKKTFLIFFFRKENPMKKLGTQNEGNVGKKKKKKKKQTNKKKNLKKWLWLITDFCE